MRKQILLSVLVLLVTTSIAVAEITEVDRKRLVSHLEMTAAWFLDEVSNLSPEQLRFRPAPGAWTILEVIDHLVVVGPIYWDDLQNAGPATAGGRVGSNQDIDILWYGVDRTNREKAIPSEDPKGQQRDLQSALDLYRKHHARLLQYARTTKDDLRQRLVKRQGCDAYQWALLISTHEQRHILQIREIKKDAKFPP